MTDVMCDLLGEFDRPLRARQPCLWINERRDAIANCADLPYGLPDIETAQRRWLRFAPLLEALFPELVAWRGIIESALIPVPHFAERLRFPHPLLVKADHALPIAGSVKARGGIYAVLCIAERIALQEGLLAREDDDHRALGSARAQAVFKRHELSVGSTGNLGLSVGIMGRALGFCTTVHMSCEAKPWKKERLRNVGAIVVEHAHDYAAACAAGRDAATSDPMIHFIDDENSLELFFGYSVAALRLRDQLHDAGIAVDREHPLFLYLPCGVGGAPGGITFGARHVFGDDAHCFFAEPVEAPCVFMGLKTRMHDAVSVYDIGLGLKTQADGLAVPRPSRLVCGLIDRLVSGCYTVTDAQMHAALRDLFETERMEIEPSAATACAGPALLLGSAAGQGYLQQNVRDPGGAGTHILWTTGGAMIPADQHAIFRAFTQQR
jgi:D-serine dehydratase